MGVNSSRNISATRWITRSAILLALTLAFQMIGFPPPITGPAVNAMLVLSALLAGPASGVVIGSLTPIIAWQRGILPPPLGPLIPFIALANAVLVILFSLLGKRHPVLGVVAGAAAKFAVLASAVQLVVTVPPPVAAAMGFPQLITALAGGAIALLAYRALKGVIEN